jgi:Dirigent-like protein
VWTFRIVLALIAVLVVSVALWPGAAPALEKPRTFSLLEVDVSGAPLGDFTFDRAPVGGDQFTETNALYRWTGAKSRGALVGRNQVVVTFVSGHGPKFTRRATLLITGQFYLPDGTLLVEGYGSVPPSGPHRFKFPVVGGTGVYANARGYIDVRDVGDGTTGTSKIDFHLLP